MPKKKNVIVFDILTLKPEYTSIGMKRDNESKAQRLTLLYRVIGLRGSEVINKGLEIVNNKLGDRDFILLLAKQDEAKDMMLDTACVKAFKVPAGVLVEVYATTLHYAPCDAKKDQGFRVLVALPKGTNTNKPKLDNPKGEDLYLTARNKWLLAHPESSEAKSGAKVGLKGDNIDISSLI